MTQLYKKEETGGVADTDNVSDQTPNYIPILDLKRLEEEAGCVADALRILITLNPDAEKLIKWADSRNVQILISDDPSAYGYFQKDEENNVAVLHLNKGLTTGLLIGTIVHELFHALQRLQNNVNFDNYMDLKSALIFELTFESAAETNAIRVAHDLYLKGIKEPLNEVVKSNTGYSDLAYRYRVDYQEKIDQGSSHDAAKQYATDQCFHNYYKQKSLFVTYATDIFEDYLDLLSDAAYEDDEINPVGGNDLTLEFMRNTFMDIEGRDLISYFKPPVTLDDIFDNLEDVREVYEYFDYKITEQTLGHDNLATLAKYNALKEVDNPFVDIDLKELKYFTEKEQRRAEILDFHEKAKSIVQIMHEMAGTSRGKQFPLDFGDGYPTYSIYDSVSRKEKKKQARFML